MKKIIVKDKYLLRISFWGSNFGNVFFVEAIYVKLLCLKHSLFLRISMTLQALHHAGYKKVSI